jgi:hypothetical protein
MNQPAPHSGSVPDPMLSEGGEYFKDLPDLDITSNFSHVK